MSALNKLNAERNQRAILDLAAAAGNDVCADCKARNPRWASYNLGIFICVNCASIHRKLGTHISKVKSLTLDEWTREQVEHMRQNGNVKSNVHYNPNEALHPPPTTMMENERDSEFEQYIRSKYQYQRFVNTSKLGPSRTALPSRAVSNPITPATSGITSQAGLGINRPSTSALPKSSTSPMARQPPARSASQPLSSMSPPQLQHTMKPMPPLPTEALPQAPSNDPVWDDLVSLSQPSVSASLPLQVQTPLTHATSLLPTPTLPFQGATSFGPMSSPNLQLFPQSQPVSSSLGTSPTMSSVPGLGISPMNTNAFQFQQQGVGYPLLSPASNLSAGLSMSGSLMVPSPQFLQPQPTAVTPIQQPVPWVTTIGVPTPMSVSPQPMQQGVSTPSPMPQAPLSTGSPYGGNNMGNDMSLQPAPPQFASQPFGSYQPQQPSFITSPQQNQFTGWMQSPTPGQHAGGQRWGGM